MRFTELAMPEAAAAVLASGARKVDAAIVAGSGFGGLSTRLGHAVEIPYSEIPGIPPVDVPGHAGRLLVGSLGGVVVALFDGRAHLYQGFSPREAAFTARLAASLGAGTIMLTNAAGGVNPEFTVGDLVLIADHLNLTAQSPLAGWQPATTDPFVPMVDAWDPALRATARAAAEDLGFTLREGVYAQLIGPQFETRAEVAMCRALGADVVGMSTVIEAIAARALGLRVLGLSLVTNAAAGEGLSHAEVLKAGDAAAGSAGDLLVGILQRL